MDQMIAELINKDIKQLEKGKGDLKTYTKSIITVYEKTKEFNGISIDDFMSYLKFSK